MAEHTERIKMFWLATWIWKKTQLFEFSPFGTLHPLLYDLQLFLSLKQRLDIIINRSDINRSEIDKAIWWSVAYDMPASYYNGQVSRRGIFNWKSG